MKILFATEVSMQEALDIVELTEKVLEQDPLNYSEFIHHFQLFKN